MATKAINRSRTFHVTTTKVSEANRRQVEALWRHLMAASVSEYVKLVDVGLSVLVLPRLIEALEAQREQLFTILNFSESTWKRRLAAKEPLTSPESDRVLRLVRILRAATEFFEGDEAAARRWLKQANRALGGASPLEYAHTEVGAEEVINLIGRLEHGVYT